MLSTYLAFVTATTVLIAIPGPNVALIVANSVARGVRIGLLTVAGTSAAMVVQLALTVFGMSTALAIAGAWFAWLRWIGVAYLIWLGFKAWQAPALDLGATQPQPADRAAIVTRGFLVSLTNPKTLFFYGAFFPQFVDPAQAPRQLLLLASTFIVLAVALDSLWAIFAGRLRGLLTGPRRLGHRLTGGILIGAGVGLALARKP